MKTTAMGFFDECLQIDFGEYLQIDAEHWTLLREMRRSPMHYLYRREHPLEDSISLAKGRAAHTATFEPDRFLMDYALFTGPVRRGKAWEAFVEQHEHQTILKTPEYHTCLAIRDAVRAHPVAARYLARGKPEQSIQWKDAETGLQCKARIDWLGDGYFFDLKTTSDLEPHRFAGTAARFGYHGQLAFYMRGLRALGVPDPKVRIIAAESKAPHDVAVFPLHPDALRAGDEECSTLLRQVADCRARDVWPGRYPEETMLELPRWTFDGVIEEEPLDIVMDHQEA